MSYILDQQPRPLRIVGRHRTCTPSLTSWRDPACYPVASILASHAPRPGKSRPRVRWSTGSILRTWMRRDKIQGTERWPTAAVESRGRGRGMAHPLLTTKLYVPPPRPNLVPRRHLIARLAEGVGLGRRLTLLSAPAGYGKTTLVSAWLHSTDRPRAWLSLDEGDNDPARFLAYLIAALQQVDDGIGQAAGDLLEAPQLPATGALVTALINDLAATPDPFVLVLDDYHTIRELAVHRAVQSLLEQQPPHMHLLIVTRVDPPLPISLLRARGQLTEIRQDDLRFSAEEATAFLNQSVGLDLAAAQIAVLENRAEGWISGLQMAALSIQHRDAESAARLIDNFSGRHHFVLDHLTDEVLRRQPEPIQRFLLQSSILERMCGPLCDQVVGDVEDWRPEDGGQGRPAHGPRSQNVLEYLESSNLFIVPLDSERQWYRYHRLFLDLLRKRLQQTLPDQMTTLHRRASVWYEQNGFVAEAIDHALSAGDLERAAHLVEQAAEATLMRGETVTFLRWVEALPGDLVRARPALGVFRAWALLVTGHPLDAAESQLQDVDESSDRMSGRVSAVRAWISALRGQIPSALEFSRRALEDLPKDDTFLRAITLWNLGISYWAEGDTVAGDQALEEAARVGRQTGNTMVAVTALCRLAGLRIVQGQLHEGQTILQRALALATERNGQHLPIAGEALNGLGELARERNDLEAAARYLTRGIELSRQQGSIGALGGYISLARVRRAQGDLAAARDLIQQAQQFAEEFDATDIDDMTVALFQARFWITEGNLEAVARWAEERGLEAALAPTGAPEGSGLAEVHLRKYEQLVLARLLIAQGRLDEALALLDPLLRTMERHGRLRGMIEVHNLKALALSAKGDLDQALVSLERALSLGRPGGYLRIFADEGEPLAALLRQAAARGIATDYAGTLLEAMSEQAGEPAGEEGGPSATAAAPPLVEPLSEREQEVLRLIAVGLSNREIAEELVVAVSTVKWHINNVYGKLGVRSRTQAVARANQLGLL